MDQAFLQGQVVGARGQPLDSIEVTAFGPGDIGGGFVYTDSNGRYSLVAERTRSELDTSTVRMFAFARNPAQAGSILAADTIEVVARFAVLSPAPPATQIPTITLLIP